MDSNLLSLPLLNALEDLSAFLDNPELYERTESALIAEWQKRNDDPLLSRVLEGEARLSVALGPLLRANLAVDARVGTNADFAEIAEKAESELDGILSFSVRKDGTSALLTSPLKATPTYLSYLKQMGAAVWAVIACMLALATAIGYMLHLAASANATPIIHYMWLVTGGITLLLFIALTRTSWRYRFEQVRIRRDRAAELVKLVERLDNQFNEPVIA